MEYFDFGLQKYDFLEFRFGFRNMQPIISLLFRLKICNFIGLNKSLNREIQYYSHHENYIGSTVVGFSFK